MIWKEKWNWIIYLYFLLRISQKDILRQMYTRKNFQGQPEKGLKISSGEGKRMIKIERRSTEKTRRAVADLKKAKQAGSRR